MTQRLAAPAATAQPATPAVVPTFTFKATKSHVQVRANSPVLGMKDLMATLKTDPKLHNCVIEQCAFDGDSFTATLRIQD
ncbi:MAG: hypothetical protein WC876_10020 [Candidatus Thermoplasmatota archaeon]|jgi:hypothetical protein